MIHLPPTDRLRPLASCTAGGTPLYLLPSTTTSLIRVDLATESGSLYQPQLLVAGAQQLWSAASRQKTSCFVADYLDHRGVLLQPYVGHQMASTTFYMLRRQAEEVLPVLAEMWQEPAFPAADLSTYIARRRQELSMLRLKSQEMVRHLFYSKLFGEGHPLSIMAAPEDADRLTPELLHSFHEECCLRRGLSHIVLSGRVDEDLVKLIETHFGGLGHTPFTEKKIDFTAATSAIGHYEMPLEQSVQTSLRVGRVLNLKWDSDEYARLMLVVVALGGYFGSRLMSNLREDKGYTYGIYAATRLYREGIVFYITADVAEGMADAAMDEIASELRRICTSPIGEEELQRVRTVMVGDFERSVDGIFERAERLSGQMETHTSERLTEHLRRVLEEVTAAELQETAARHLSPSQMLYCRAGA